MANYKLEKSTLEVNKVSGGDYWFFIYDGNKNKLKKDIQYIEPNSTSKTESKYTIFAADTEQECIDKKIELQL
jgi:hypothetical protein